MSYYKHNIVLNSRPKDLRWKWLLHESQIYGKLIDLARNWELENVLERGNEDVMKLPTLFISEANKNAYSRRTDICDHRYRGYLRRFDGGVRQCHFQIEPPPPMSRGNVIMCRECLVHSTITFDIRVPEMDPDNQS
jgi:hypothetical protein